MEPEEITDSESLKRWLEGRPREDAIWIAQRAALRVLPLWIVEVLRPSKREVDLKSLPILRAVLTSGVARKYPTPEVKAAARAASYAASAAAKAVHDAPYYDSGSAAARSAAARVAERDEAAASVAAAAAAAGHADANTAAPGHAFPYAYNAARAAAALASFAYSAAAYDAAGADPADSTAAAHAAYAAAAAQFSADARALVDGVSEHKPLWGTPPDWFAGPFHDMRTTWVPATPGGDFWMRWYQGFLDGIPLTWDLQHDIALIPDIAWQMGEAHIAGLIAEI